MEDRYLVRSAGRGAAHGNAPYSCLVVDSTGEDPDLKVVTRGDARKIAKKLNRMDRKEKLLKGKGK